MHLVDIDVIRSKPAQRIVDLPHDPFAARIAKDLAISPFKPNLRGDDHARALVLSDCLADDFFRTAETIDGSGIDHINAMIQRGVNGRHRFGFVGSPHIQPPIAQVPIAMRETFSDVPGISVTSM